MSRKFSQALNRCVKKFNLRNNKKGAKVTLKYHLWWLLLTYEKLICYAGEAAVQMVHVYILMQLFGSSVSSVYLEP